MTVSNGRRDARLRGALSESFRAFACVGLFSFFINVLVLTVPLYMLQIYDRVITSRSEETLVMLTVLATGLLVTVGVLEFVRSRVLVCVGERIDEKLNGELFASMVDDRLSGKRAYGSQPIRDLDTIRSFLTGPGLLAFFDAPWIPLFIALTFVLHPLLGTISLASAVVLFGLAVLSEFMSRRPLQGASRAAIAADSFAESSSRNAEVIRALGMLPGVRDRWLQWHSGAIALQAKASTRSAAITASVKFFRPLVQVMILAAGAYLATEQIITPGVMIAASIILGRALAPVEGALNGWRSFMAARLAHGRLSALLAAHPPAPESMPLPRPLGQIKVKDLSAAPPGVPKPLIRGIQFQLQPGEILGVIGPSAAGKSLLAKLLVGNWPPLSGHVRLDGVDIAEWDREDVGPHIGYLPQDVELFDGTVAENIARFGKPDPEATVAAARRAGVHEMILELPQGYDTVIGEGRVVLSGGQRQRIALARALYGDPTFIVLDEPNSNLDTEGDDALRNAIEALKAARRTVVIVSHRVAALAAVDKVLVVRDGRMEALVSRQELMERLVRPATPLVEEKKAAPEAEPQAEAEPEAETGPEAEAEPKPAAQFSTARRPSVTGPGSLTSLVRPHGKTSHRPDAASPRDADRSSDAGRRSVSR